ncbi:MAG: hypothetical protein H0W87_02930 [Actinobacteria bacterium]|nr:hypothetical protein [Actinomycetota bacterium]
MTRFERRRDSKERMRRASDSIPLPSHPYRSSAIFYAVLSAILLGVTYATGGGMPRALLFAGGFFVIATGFTWMRFRNKLAEQEREDSR